MLERKYNYKSVLNFYNIILLIKNFENFIVNNFVQTKKILLKNAKKRNTKRVFFNNNSKFLRSIFKQR